MKASLSCFIFSLAIVATNATSNFAVDFSNAKWDKRTCVEEFAALKATVWDVYQTDLLTNRKLRGDRKLLCQSSWCADPILLATCNCPKRRDLEEVSDEVAGAVEEISEAGEFSGGGENAGDLERKAQTVGSYVNLLSGEGKKTAEAVYAYADGMNNGVCKDLVKGMTYRVYAM
jgi:hypothetical protein